MAIGKTYTIKLDDKAAFLNRLQKQQIQVNAADIQDNTLNHTFTITIHDPDQVQVIDQLLQQSKDIDDNPSTKLPPLKTNHPKLQELRQLIKNELDEIKIVPNISGLGKVDGNKILGKNKNNIINKSTHKISNVKQYSWDEALQQNVFPRNGITLKNVKKLFIDMLGVTPQKVYVEETPGSYKSFYVKANYHGSNLLFVRRETPIGSIGQTKLYSPYGKIVTISSYISDRPEDKEKIIDLLGL